MKLLFELLPLIVWGALWTAGGWLLAASVFCLRRNETAMVGVSIGLAVEVWLANLLAHRLPIVTASWLSAGLVLLAGIAAEARAGVALPGLRGKERDGQTRFSWGQWLVLAGLTLLFTLIGRGLGIFDDYQNLPTISLMATGDVPPHFALNPSLNFGYHYFLLLFSAQLMRLGSMFSWTALDVARGLLLALPLMLAGLWGYRLTRNQLAAALTAAVLAFAGGARWLLLLLPQPVLAYISDNIKLIGSASTSAPSLAAAMLTFWKIDGAGPVPFPFAFYTGINQPYVMAYTGIAGSGILILLVLLLLAGRTCGPAGWLVFFVLMSALALANEIAFLLLAFGSVIVAIASLIRHRSWKLPRDLLRWFGVLIASGMVAAVQGGLMTEMIRGWLMVSGGQSGYFDTSLSFVWPPALVSAHLGSLSVANPAQLIAALVEIGPIVLVTPLLLAWGVKSFRLGRWYEASLIAASAAALVALFIQFKGPLFTAWPRLLGAWFLTGTVYSVPLLWAWGRGRSGRQAAAGVVVLTACLSGLVLFGIQLLAIQRPVLATFLTPLDARISREYWNKLDPEALVFDPVVFRAPTVFGRFTDSSPSWYARDPGWQSLAAAPDPRAIHAAGFDYMYFDKDYWDNLSAAQQAALSASCIRQVAQVDGIHSEQDYSKDFRRLIDISACK